MILQVNARLVLYSIKSVSLPLSRLLFSSNTIHALSK